MLEFLQITSLFQIKLILVGYSVQFMKLCHDFPWAKKLHLLLLLFGFVIYFVKYDVKFDITKSYIKINKIQN